MSISIAIMAAGFGTRMKSKLPKVLHKISGYEILYHIIKESKKISDDITVILYHRSDLIKKEMKKNHISVIQYLLILVQNGVEKILLIFLKMQL